MIYVWEHTQVAFQSGIYMHNTSSNVHPLCDIFPCFPLANSTTYMYVVQLYVVLTVQKFVDL